MTFPELMSLPVCEAEMQNKIHKKHCIATGDQAFVNHASNKITTTARRTEISLFIKGRFNNNRKL